MNTLPWVSGQCGGYCLQLSDILQTNQSTESETKAANLI